MKLLNFLFVFGLVFCNNIAKCQNITTVAGGVTGHGSYWGDGGPATACALGYFAGLIVDSHGNIYISDGNNQRIRKVDYSTGVINTIAGTGIAGYNGDGILATNAQLNNPVCISLDSGENLYVYDYGNNRVRRIDAITGIISTYVGNGVFGSGGDGGPATAASIDGGEMYWDLSNNLYITGTRKIRRITALGIINTFAGTGAVGVTGDGIPATSAFLAEVRGIAIDHYGNFFLADSTGSIRKISAATGLIYRVAGTGDNVVNPYSGDFIPATACHIGPFDISVDDTGNLYIPDYTNSRIEKVDTFNTIYTIAGTGVAGFSGDGGAASSAQLSHPENVVLDKCGNVYICDFNNKRVRKMIVNPSCDLATLSTKSITPNAISTNPNPVKDKLTVHTSFLMHEITIVNLFGKVVIDRRINSSDEELDMANLPSGLYILRIISRNGDRNVIKVIKE